MFLSHQTIKRYIDEGKIIIGPEFDKKDIRPVGVRIHLGKSILIPEAGQTVEIQSSTELKYKKVDLTKEEFYLEPGAFVLGATHETIQTPPDVLAILDGRSTLARLGVSMHISSCVIDGALGAPQVVVMEIKNVGNFRVSLQFKDPVAEFVFTELTEPVVQKGQSQYNNQDGVAPPNLKFRTGRDK